eukprot:CAMPEP_0116126492 /NCGR_PEP_ID=MMETSP0329-20121206/6359_1 /TAXON_ID=697910 /ORGANISM="Pseudo-nitzschia arenysensis, Strain B593" /LENGTH=550 /DNA_ID=CAMNT_0003620575 /DNA_START=130 /DNA_END=1782 /DNA_ORIENTATION=-
MMSHFQRPTLFFILALSWAGNLISTCSARGCHTSFRRAWRDLSCEEQDDFLGALSLVKDTGVYDEFIEIHAGVAAQTHAPAEFLPWHRWFLHNFEKLLQETTGKCIYLPYWDWERDAGWESWSDVMNPATFGSWGQNGCVSSGVLTWNDNFNWNPGVNGGGFTCVQREFMGGRSFTGEAQILGMISNYNQFADTTGNARGQSQGNPAARGSTNSFRVELENGPHMLVHALIGGHMRNNWSPADPLFYLHHTNVDRIWAMWQDYWDHDLLDVDELTSPWHYDSDWGLDSQMPFWHAGRISDWDFRMRYNSTYSDIPTVRDVMSNDSPLFAVRYSNSYLNSLMPDYEPNPRWFTPASDSVPVRCDRDDWEWRKKRRMEEQINQETNVEEIKAAASSEASSSTTTTTSSSTTTNTNAFRSSLRGDDAQAIEENPESFYRNPDRFKNNQVGNGMDIRSSNADPIEVTHDYCGRPPVFTMQEDREQWDHFCQVLPQNTTMAERLALMAESNCAARGDPRTDDPEIKERMSNMTMLGNFDAPSSAYECFSRPDAYV